MSQNNQGNLLNTSNNSITANPLSDTFQNQKKSMGQSANIAKAESQRFNILIRIRPQIPHDLVELTTEEELKPCVFKKNEKKLILRNEKSDNDYEMTFDHVMNESSDQVSIYQAFGDKLIRDVFKGYNGTIMAYGQTGSGKSYTVFGKGANEVDKNSYEANKGIVQRAVKQIFDYKEANKDKKHISVFVSFMQVYLNQITDLLNENNNEIIFNAAKTQFKVGKESKNLSIENSLTLVHDKNGVYVKDLSVKEVSNEEELLDLINNGIFSRVTASTSMNKQSSRSHAIIQITVKQKWIERIKNNTTNEITDNLHNLKGMLTIVDLAGSESVSRTGSEGINQDEAKEINKSISALGRVIEALSKNSKNSKNMHVSYRDSKLTELLSECLGGNSKTVIIACVSPFTANCEETYSTLQFASRAMIIRTQAKKNEKIDTKKFNKEDTKNNQEKSYQGINDGIDNIENLQRLDEKAKNDKRRFNDNMLSVERRLGDMRERFDNMKRGRSYDLGRNNKSNNDGIGNKEDFQNITKKFYSMIVHLQDELSKLTVKNYALEEENNFLKEQLRNLN